MKIRGLVLAASVLLFLYPMIFDNAFAQVKKIKVQKIKPGRLSGSILDSSKRRLEGKTVQILDAEGRMVGSAVSDKYGMYQISNVPEGEFLLKVEDQVIARIHATRTATVSSIQIVIPAKVEPLTPLQWTLIGVGSTAVLVGIVAIIDHNDNSSTTYIPISP